MTLLCVGGGSSIRMPLGKILLNNEEENKLGMEDSGEYEDFPQEPIQLEASYLLPSDVLRSSHIFKSPSKRYLGIEIPDYVSSPSKGSLLKTIQNRMKAAGK